MSGASSLQAPARARASVRSGVNPNRVQMPHGSIVELHEDGSPRRWLAPDGRTIADIDDAEVRLDLVGVHDRPILIGEPIEEHPVLGRTQSVRVVFDQGESVVARVAETDWTHPENIPAIDAPARIPAGAGTVLLNVLAISAQRLGRSLRYVGPYPTSQLWSSLRQCFRPVGGDEAKFTEGVFERAVLGESREVPVDFEPAPFERVQVGPRAVVHLRDGVERLYLGGLAWARQGAARRLVPIGDEMHVQLWIGGASWGEVAVLDAAGRLLSGPKPLPTVQSNVLGRPFPPALRGALGELMTDDEPPLLAQAMREVLRDVEIVWGDPGADVARVLGGVLVVHAGLWERLGQGPVAPLAQALAAALSPPVKLLAQQRLETVPLGAAVH
jgi:hypothetical protein